VQLFCECVSLLLVSVTFLVVGAICSRRIKAAGNDTAKMAARSSSPTSVLPYAAAGSDRLRRDITVTVSVVFCTFFCRLVFCATLAVAEVFQSRGVDCDQCDASCQNEFSLMRLWFDMSPEVQSAVIFVSSPCTLLVALFCMTTTKLMDALRVTGMNLRGTWTWGHTMRSKVVADVAVPMMSDGS
jgi:hypothetical protein